MLSDGEPLLKTQTQVYARRWWILFVFSLTCTIQSMVWSTWGPIAESAEFVLNWTDGNVAFITNLGNISYFFLVLPLCVLMDTRGLRFAMILCTFSLVVATGSRCFSLDPLAATITAYLCGFIQGFAGAIPFSAPPLVAAVWFPHQERSVATAIGSFWNYCGVSLSFIIGPQLVPGPIYEQEVHNSTVLDLNVSEITRHVNNTDSMKQGIRNLLYTHTAIAVISFLLVLMYFPAKPPTPPSITASIPRTNNKRALMDVLRNGPLWIILIAGSLPLCIVSEWVALLDVVLKPLGVSQIDAGWMGFWHTLIGCFFGIIIAKFSDFFRRRRKVFLIILFVLAVLCSVWLNLICSGFVGFDLRSLFASVIMLGIFINGTTPLFYEMCVEASYPVAEGFTGGWYTLISVVFGSMFLSLVSVPGIGTTWMNWTVLGSIVVAVPLLCIFPERNKRTDIDYNITSNE